MMRQFNDRAAILLEDVKTHKDGYKIIRSKIARTGLQKYLAKELTDSPSKYGLTANSIVTVYRPESEVFSDDAVNGWAGVPVTRNHPPELVTPENVSKYQVGNVRDKAHIDTIGGWIGLEYMVLDAKSIKEFDDGDIAEVSGGYQAEIVWGDGITDDGKKYQATQTKIVPNHLALVSKGRAFSDGAINWGASPVTTKGPEMDFKSLVFGDKAINVAVTDADKLMAIIADKDGAIGALKAEVVLKDAELKVFKDAELAVFSAELTAAKEAVKAHPQFGDAAIEGAADAEIITMHKTIKRLCDAKPDKDDTARKTIADMKTKSEGNIWDKIIASKGGK